MVLSTHHSALDYTICLDPIPIFSSNSQGYKLLKGRDRPCLAHCCAFGICRCSVSMSWTNGSWVSARGMQRWTNAVPHSRKNHHVFEEGTLAHLVSKLNTPCAFSPMFFEGRAVLWNVSLFPGHLSSDRGVTAGTLTQTQVRNTAHTLCWKPAQSLSVL